MKIIHAIDATSVLDQTSSRKPGKVPIEIKRPSYLKRIEQILGGVLDHAHTLIYNIKLQQGAIQAPLALLSPSGVTLFYFDHQRGVFRAIAGEWEKLDERRKQYRPSQPNPVQIAHTQANALRIYLAERGYSHVNIQAVVTFTDPGIHIEAEGIETRCVYLDGFPRCAVNLARAQPTLKSDELQSLMSLLAPYTLEEALATQEIHDDFSLRDKRPQRVQTPPNEMPLPPEDKFVKAIRKVPFSQRQLIVIAFLVIVNILILIALVLVVLSLS